MQLKSLLNDELIAAMKSKIPENADLVGVLTDIFPYMGKQAIYRRIRQEVPFLFEEVVKISKRLNISIDKIVGMVDNKQAVFDINTFDPDFFNQYKELQERDLQFFLEMSKSSQFKIRSAVNTLPVILYLPYENITRFRVYKWLYQTKNDPELSFSKIIFPESLVALQKESKFTVNNIKNYHLIIDDNLFSSVIKDIAFFYKRNLVTQRELQLLKEELLQLLERLIKITTSGVNENGHEVSIFLSSINIESMYGYLEGEGTEFSRIDVYDIDGITTQNPNVVQKQKQWIDSLKKFSIMISQSGEIERINFFNKQRELIQEMDQIL